MIIKPLSLDSTPQTNFETVALRKGIHSDNENHY